MKVFSLININKFLNSIGIKEINLNYFVDEKTCNLISKAIYIEKLENFNNIYYFKIPIKYNKNNKKPKLKCKLCNRDFDDLRNKGGRPSSWCNCCFYLCKCSFCNKFFIVDTLYLLPKNIKEENNLTCSNTYSRYLIWKNMDKDIKEEKLNKLHNGQQKWMNSLTQEERSNLCLANQFSMSLDEWNQLSEDEKLNLKAENMNKNRQKYIENSTKEERSQNASKAANCLWEKLDTKEKRNEHLNNAHKKTKELWQKDENYKSICLANLFIEHNEQRWDFNFNINDINCSKQCYWKNTEKCPVFNKENNINNIKLNKFGLCKNFLLRNMNGGLESKLNPIRREDFYNTKINNLDLTLDDIDIDFNSLYDLSNIPGVWSRWSGNICLQSCQSEDIGKEMMSSIRSFDAIKEELNNNDNKNIDDIIKELEKLKKENLIESWIVRYWKEWRDILELGTGLQFKLVAKNIYDLNKRLIIEMNYAHKYKAKWWSPQPGIQTKMFYEIINNNKNNRDNKNM